ncbi:MAG: hypothetical protein EBT69_07835 [Verrucomicrobia bacterium]|jgi:hypothetical protein|nr:hypothetical protein [Verrucomicrobiota bacterium]
MSKIMIKNNRIIDFYNKYPQIDIEKVNIMIVEMLENIILNFEGDITKNMVTEVFKKIQNQTTEITNMKEEFNNTIKNNSELTKSNQQIITNELSTIKDTLNKLNSDITKLNSDITNNVITKFYELKNNYVEDLKLIIDKSGSENILKILEKLEKENDKIVDKTTLIINDIVPKNISNYYLHHEIAIKNFKEDMTKQIEQLKETNISIDKIQFIFTEKYNNLSSTIQNNILNYITTSEEKIKNTINEIKDISSQTNVQQENINNELIKFLSQYKIASKKGQFGENLLESILTSIFPSAEIINTTGDIGSGDFILQRKDKVKILLENKNYDSTNISKKEVEKFINDIENQKCSGIMMSQRTGISSKQNFEIDINNGNVLIYIHNMNYDSDKILLACDIIDNLTEKIKDIEKTDNSIVLSECALIKINEQYQKFISKREEIINYVNENTKTLITMIKTLELSDLNNILCSKFASTKISNNTVFKCNRCNDKEFTTMRSLSNHKRYCFVKPISDTQSESNSETSTKTLKQLEPAINIATKEISEQINIVDTSKKNKKKNSKIEVTM